MPHSPLYPQDRFLPRMQRVAFIPITLQLPQPAADQILRHGHIEMLMPHRVLPQIIPRQPEQGRRRLQPLFLQMHERPRQLDKPFVVGVVRAFPVQQPQILQHIVRLIEELLIETLEETDVMGIQCLPPPLLDHRRYLRALLAHTAKLSRHHGVGKPPFQILFRIWSLLRHELRAPRSESVFVILHSTNSPSRKIDIPRLVPHSRLMVKPALGRGLGALLGGAGAMKPAPASPSPAAPAAEAAPAQAAPAPVQTPAGEVIRKIPLSEVHPCSFQPRKDFAPEAIQDLAASIKEQGIVQPLLVRKSADGYELIAGERRWRAAQVVGLSEVPVIIREATDAQLLELALIENLQRENLNPIEEALGYNQLLGQFGLTQEQVSTKVGKSRASVANALRLLKLAPELQGYLRHNQLSVGHAKVILGLAVEAEQKLAAERVIKDGLSVRETEDLVAAMLGKSGKALNSKSSKKAAPKDAHTADLERKLQERFGTRVALKYKAGKGSVEIRFFNDDDLERVLQIAGIQMD